MATECEEGQRAAVAELVPGPATQVKRAQCGVEAQRGGDAGGTQARLWMHAGKGGG